MKQTQPLIIGHRGAAGEAPENTLVSFLLAVEQGAHALELDVHLSADGEMIVCHDETVTRTTNGTGAIAHMTVEQLKQLDAGARFNPRFAGEPLPLLAEVFAAIPNSIMINVEVKCSYSDRLLERFTELLQEYDRLSSVVVSSFDHKILVKLKQALPELRIGLLYTANFASHRLMAEQTGVEVYSLHPYYKLLDAEDIQDAVAHGLEVYPFTINAEAELQQAVEAGVTGIITDYPERLRRLLATHAKL
ncbi:glycerophosphodiester phosphodiesterase [Paenibacillus rigui]|uniref:Glycerophosphodiester phosphodiesterase n=1 Tax=Paenibacillus rigui TaxID=554312 RepID=A0A229UY52_9BACL|nr:glycerophosphodiester phosphodiesterase family protein [Paenibacillus rigui]OXM88422.1 glycerophosphodiester phosphodiesterase [Paenibacillus rigui]